MKKCFIRLEEDGKVLSPEELLYRCVHYINLTHDKVSHSSLVSHYHLVTAGGRPDGRQVTVSRLSRPQWAGPPPVVGDALLCPGLAPVLVLSSQPRGLPWLGPSQVRAQDPRSVLLQPQPWLGTTTEAGRGRRYEGGRERHARQTSSLLVEHVTWYIYI